MNLRLKLCRQRLRALAGGMIVALLLAEGSARWLLSYPGVFPAVPVLPVATSVLPLALLGESTAAGEPYNHSLLAMAACGMRPPSGTAAVQIDNYAVGGLDLRSAVRRYHALAHRRPAALVVYSGHNEYVANYAVADAGLPSIPLGMRWSRLLLLMQHGWLRRRTAMQDGQYHGALFRNRGLPAGEEYVQTGRLRQQWLELIRECREQGIFLVIFVPAGNRMFPPTLSAVPWLHAAERNELRKTYREVHRRLYLDGDTEGARPLLRTAADRFPAAQLAYERGRLAWSDGDTTAAAAWLDRAAALDAHPISMSPVHQAMLRNIAREHDVPCIDVTEVIRRRFGNTIPDDSLFWDAHHPRLPLYCALAEELAQVLTGDSRSPLHGRFEMLPVTPALLDNSLRLPPDTETAAGMVHWHTYVTGRMWLRTPLLERAAAYGAYVAATAPEFYDASGLAAVVRTPAQMAALRQAENDALVAEDD